MKHKLPPILVKTEHKKRYLSTLRKTQQKDDLKPYYDFMGEEYVSTLTEYITAARQVGPEDELVYLADAAKKYQAQRGLSRTPCADGGNQRDEERRQVDGQGQRHGELRQQETPKKSTGRKLKEIRLEPGRLSSAPACK